MYVCVNCVCGFFLHTARPARTSLCWQSLCGGCFSRLCCLQVYITTVLQLVCRWYVTQPVVVFWNAFVLPLFVRFIASPGISLHASPRHHQNKILLCSRMFLCSTQQLAGWPMLQSCLVWHMAADASSVSRMQSAAALVCGEADAAVAQPPLFVCGVKSLCPVDGNSSASL